MKAFYTWEAKFNGDIPNINQFEKDGKENLFKDVEDNIDKLETFRLVGEDGSFYEANLVKGEIDCNGKNVESLSKVSGKVGLIYSRRNRVRVQIGKGTPLDSRITHRIGLKDDNEEIVIEVFPGLGQVEKKVEVITIDKNRKEGTVEDITKKV